MNNATLLEGSSVILGEQDIVLNGDDQMSNSEEVERNDDDDDGGYGDNSEVENDSSDSSIKLTWKHMKKNQTKSSELLEETRLATVSVPEAIFLAQKTKKSPGSFQRKFGEIFVKLSC
jgi:hypothetical protein